MAEPQVLVISDYENMVRTAVEQFRPGTPPDDTPLHPGRLADAISGAVAARCQVHPRRPTDIRVFRGLPSDKHDRAANALNQRQASNWTRDRRVAIHMRPLQYLAKLDKPREKGIEVLCALHAFHASTRGDFDSIILASHDSDLVPALEMAHELGGTPIDTVRWEGAHRLGSNAMEIPSTYLAERVLTHSVDKLSTRAYRDNANPYNHFPAPRH